MAKKWKDRILIATLVAQTCLLIGLDYAFRSEQSAIKNKKPIILNEKVYSCEEWNYTSKEKRNGRNK